MESIKWKQANRKQNTGNSKNVNRKKKMEKPESRKDKKKN